MKIARILILSIGSLLSLGAQATILSVSGQGAIIPAPSQVLDGAVLSTTDLQGNFLQNGFNEQQNVTLTSALLVDGGSIGAGTVVNSHMIFLNADNTLQDTTATWTFDGNILGIMSDKPGSLEVNSSALLGLGTTAYPTTTFNARGLETNNIATNDGYFLPTSNQLTLRMRVTQPGDWIRVVTAANVPEPSTIVLMVVGILGFSAFRRK